MAIDELPVRTFFSPGMERVFMISYWVLIVCALFAICALIRGAIRISKEESMTERLIKIEELLEKLVNKENSNGE